MPIAPGSRIPGSQPILRSGVSLDQQLVRSGRRQISASPGHFQKVDAPLPQAAGNGSTKTNGKAPLLFNDTATPRIHGTEHGPPAHAAPQHPRRAPASNTGLIDIDPVRAHLASCQTRPPLGWASQRWHRGAREAWTGGRGVGRGGPMRSPKKKYKDAEANLAEVMWTVDFFSPSWSATTWPLRFDTAMYYSYGLHGGIPARDVRAGTPKRFHPLATGDETAGASQGVAAWPPWRRTPSRA